MKTRFAPSVVCPAVAGGTGATGVWWFYGVPRGEA